MTKLLMTADDLLRMPDDEHRYELIRGELIRMSPAMPEHGWHGAEVLLSIGGYAKPRRLGVVFDSSVGYKFEVNPDTVLEPDVSFFRMERVPPRKDWKKYFTIPPDIVVEVLSPSERRAHINEKIRIYLGVGVRLLWLIDPRRRIVTVYAPGREPLVLRHVDVLSGEDVLPGFWLPLSDLFGSSNGIDDDGGTNGADFGC